MSKFNSKSNTKTTNLAGGEAFERTPKEELVFAVLTTFLDNKFYESGDERQERIKNLVKDINDDNFVAKLAIFARREFHMRSVSHLLAGELALNHKGDSLVKDTIVGIAERPDDLTEVASYVGRPMPKQVKRGIRNAILKFDAYQLAKYRNEGKDFSLVDLFNLTHPKVKHADKFQKEAWKQLMNGTLKSEKSVESKLSNAKDSEQRKENLADMVKNDSIGYMALLRNLNNLLKYDVGEDVIDKAAQVLTNKERVKKSKQLPFRFHTAYENLQGSGKLATAVSDAMDIAVENVPEFSGKTLIAVDSSGSMGGMYSSDSPLIKAAIFASAFYSKNPDSDLITFSTTLTYHNFSARTPILDMTSRIVNESKFGGTQTSLVFDYADGKVYDRIIIISDNESWVEAMPFSAPGNVQNAYNEYCRKTGADPYVYAIDIQGYGTSDMKGSKVFHLTSWSEKLFDFMKTLERGNQLIKEIEDYEIGKAKM